MVGPCSVSADLRASSPEDVTVLPMPSDGCVATNYSWALLVRCAVSIAPMVSCGDRSAVGRASTEAGPGREFRSQPRCREREHPQANAYEYDEAHGVPTGALGWNCCATFRQALHPDHLRSVRVNSEMRCSSMSDGMTWRTAGWPSRRTVRTSSSEGLGVIGNPLEVHKARGFSSSLPRAAGSRCASR
jgi:hypothetical protein